MFNSVEWGYFKLKDLFEEIKISKSLNKNQLNFSDDEENINYITRSSSNNGLLGKVYSETLNLESFIVEGNCLTVAMVGESFTTFYQKDNFITSQNIAVLRNKNLSKYDYFFLIPILEKEMYRYGYGRTLNITHLQNTKIKLPIVTEGKPNWDFMRDYIKNLSNNNLDDFYESKNKNNIKLQDREWISFKITDFFNIKTGKDLVMRNADKGNIPVVSHSTQNNSVTHKIARLENNQVIDCENSIAVASIGTIYATVQPENYYLATRVKALIAKKDNEKINHYILMFLSTLINLESYRYNYGRNASHRLSNLKIKLPVDKERKPDWQFMEDYIKSLPYTKYL